MMGYLTSPRVALGVGALEQLSTLDLHRVALLLDVAVADSARVARLREEIAKTDARLEVLPPVRAEPSVLAADELGERLRTYAPDWIVAVGGGSTIDLAKAGWLRYARPEIPLADVTSLAELKLREAAHFVAVPTTAGSGSEMTGLIHLHRDPETPILEIAARELEPDWALLDPYFITSLAPKQLALGAGDALAHAFEAIASEWSNPFTDALAREAIGRIVQELPKGLRHGDQFDRLEPLQAAAAMAGLAVANSQAGVLHAIAHALGARFGLAHAALVAPLLPVVLEYNFGAAKERYQTLQGVLGPGPVQSRHALGARLRLFVEQSGLPRTLPEAGVARERLAAERERLVALTLASPSLVGNPRMPSGEEVTMLLEAAATGTSPALEPPRTLDGAGAA